MPWSISAVVTLTVPSETDTRWASRIEHLRSVRVPMGRPEWIRLATLSGGLLFSWTHIKTHPREAQVHVAN